MTDEIKSTETVGAQGQGQEQGQKPPSSETGRTDLSSLPADVQRYIDELKAESIKHRRQAKAQEDAARKAEEQRLAEAQEWKTLAEQRAARLAELEAIREQADAIQEAFAASVEARLKDVPKELRGSLIEPVRAKLSPAEFAKWLDANEALWKPKRAPQMDAGAGSASSTSAGTSVRLTPEQVAMAQAMQITPERYAQRLLEMQKGKNKE